MNISKKALNLVTTINVLLFNILLLLFIRPIIFLKEITEIEYFKIVYFLFIFGIFFSFSKVLNYIRNKMQLRRRYHFSKNDVKNFALSFLSNVMVSLIICLVFILIKDFEIANLNAYQKLKFSNVLNIIFMLCIIIFSVYINIKKEKSKGV